MRCRNRKKNGKPESFLPYLSDGFVLLVGIEKKDCLKYYVLL